jgi:hypothetical protein
MKTPRARQLARGKRVDFHLFFRFERRERPAGAQDAAADLTFVIAASGNIGRE